MLDDGWFRGRRSDRAGLGDWQVDPDVWPEGLHPLVDHVQRAGHGLRALGRAGDGQRRLRPGPGAPRLGAARSRRAARPTWRHQQVLDLQHPDAYAHVLGQLRALLDEYDIAFLKWDHNRDLVDVAHDGRPAVHGQTLAFYRLLDELREAHPDLEIESCASGGGRIDLEVLDPHRPGLAQRHHRRRRAAADPALDLAAGAAGAARRPISAGRSRTPPGARHRTGFRAATALFGHFGIEWDLRGARPATSGPRWPPWVALHKELRPLVGRGRLVRGDHPDPAVLRDRRGRPRPRRGAGTSSPPSTPRSPSRSARSGCPVSTRTRSYVVVDRTPAGERHRAGLGATWLDGDGVTLGRPDARPVASAYALPRRCRREAAARPRTCCGQAEQHERRRPARPARGRRRHPRRPSRGRRTARR